MAGVVGRKTGIGRGGSVVGRRAGKGRGGTVVGRRVEKGLEDRVEEGRKDEICIVTGGNRKG